MSIYGWYDLTWKEQRRVLRLARRGERHPDPCTARVAEEWVREKLEPGAFWTVIATLFGGDDLWERRRARRIIRVAAGRRSGKR
ncbi:hypothetical protein DQ237_09255 [Blastococcus sp. TF02-8]|uniref:hypothetical protein n=1 Tax=Blastococcus sp. TF02-8 TaxID=2250574 RepID=UPI000DEA66F9|nr:hypothetical protein [Blastococcus sp. TF02-8]RBY96073.1 hypothetical protein DQ237_09255 [Blastococcus sp. TF02-8]